MTAPFKSPRPVIGLLGGVAAGKSLVAAGFAELGCAVVDADRMAHELLAEPAIRQALVKRFGPDILGASGEIDRRQLGRKAFAGREAVAALDAILAPVLWPRVTQAVEAARRTAAPAVVLDAALILEKGLDRVCDALVYIQAPPEARRARAQAARGWDPSETARREAVQVSLKVKQDRSDYTLDNSASPDHTIEQVRAILAQLAK
jgi:dephospho-CoA kinase